MEKKNWWLSWISLRLGFTLHWPWWVTGYQGERPIFVAAVQAEDEDAAKNLIYAAYDTKVSRLYWRFCNEMPDDWEPFNERFPRADWMHWGLTGNKE